MRAEDNKGSGMSLSEDELDATRRFGNRALIAEKTRTLDTLNWLETIWQDLRYAWRVMRKNRGFRAMAFVIVAVGFGARTTLFSITGPSLHKPLHPVNDTTILIRTIVPHTKLHV